MVEYVCKGFPYKPELGCFGMATSLLIHDNYNILFDTGNYGARKRIIELLESNKIDIVVISHLHFDHCFLSHGLRKRRADALTADRGLGELEAARAS